MDPIQPIFGDNTRHEQMKASIEAIFMFTKSLSLSLVANGITLVVMFVVMLR